MRARPLFALAVLGLGLGLGLIEAQPTATPSTPAAESQPTASPPLPPEPVPVPVPEIPRQSERTLNRLKEIEASLAADPAVTAIGTALPDWSAEMKKLREGERSRREAKAFSLRELEDLSKMCLLKKAELDGWQKTLEARAVRLQQSVEELQGMRALWNVTKEDSSRELPASVVRSINGVLAEITRIDRLARERLAASLTLQNEVASEAAHLKDDLDAIAAASAEARTSLLSPDAKPLWDELAEENPDHGLFDQARISWSAVRSTIRAFLSGSPERFTLQALLFFAILALFRWLGRHGRKWSEREELQHSMRILAHPVANALLIALLLTRVIHPQAPLAVYELVRLLLLGPLLWVLPGLLGPGLRLGLYGLAGLYVVDLINALVPDDTLLGRVLLMSLSLASLGGLVWLTRPLGALSRLASGRWRGAALAVGRGGVLVLGFAIVANVVGLVRLAELLTDTVLFSVYAAVALVAGTLVLEGLITLVLETAGARTLRSARAKGLHLRTTAVRLLRFVAVASWVMATLGAVQLIDPFLARLRAVLEASLKVGQLSLSLGAVLALVVTLWLSFQISRITRVVLDDDVLPRLDLPRGVPGTISKLVHYAILFVGVIFALAAAGFQLSQFALLAGAFGVGIGFGLQNIVNNFVSGLILLFERPIQSGDTVELGKLLGTVSRIGIRSSTIRTFDGAEVIVPNARLIENEVVNWTLSDRLRRIEVVVGVAYGTPPRQVLEILLGVAKAHPQVLVEPASYALFEGFGDSSLNFILRAWTGNFDEFLKTRSELRIGVYDALEAAGITIPFPQRDLHIVSMPEDAKLVATAADDEPRSS